MTSLPYLLLAFILFVLYLAEKGRIRYVSCRMARITAYVIMWIFIGLRGHIMSDFIVYYQYFQHYPNLFQITGGAFINGFEIGFNIYTAFIKIFTDNYFVWVAINTLIDLVVLAWFFHRYAKSMILPLIFFLAFNGLLIEFNLYRNMKAIDLFLLSIPYLQKRSIIPYVLLNLLGTLFHTSSFLYIPLYFLLDRRMPEWIVWGGFVMANIFFIFKIGIISNLLNSMPFIQSLGAYDKLMNYSNTGEEFGFSIGYIERTVSFLLFTVFRRQLILRNPDNTTFYNSYWFYYCSFLFFYEVQVFVERIPTLFIFSYWILYPQLMYCRKRYLPIIRAIVSVLVVMKIYSAYNMPSASYQNILFEESDFETRKKIVEQDLNAR